MTKKKILDVILSVVTFVIVAVLFGVYLILKETWRYSIFLLVINFVICAGWLIGHTRN